MEEPRHGGWRTFLLFGCGLVLALSAGLGWLAKRHWPEITSFYRQTAATLGELGSVQSVIQARYRTPDVSVQSVSGMGSAQRTLWVTLTNPPWLSDLDLDGPSGNRKALEIARAARDALPAQSSYDRYVVMFVRQREFGLTFSSKHSFSFSPTELGPRSPDSR